jgi:hypothetical protein
MKNKDLYKETNEEPKKKKKTILNYDWERIDRYLVAGASGYEVANCLGICHHSLREAVRQKFGMPFVQYKQDKLAKGDSLLKLKQFDEAMSGNISMLIWLGKVRLKQRDDLKINENFDGKLASILDLIKEKGTVDPDEEAELKYELSKDNQVLEEKLDIMECSDLSAENHG